MLEEMNLRGVIFWVTSLFIFCNWLQHVDSKIQINSFSILKNFQLVNNVSQIKAICYNNSIYTFGGSFNSTFRDPNIYKYDFDCQSGSYGITDDNNTTLTQVESTIINSAGIGNGFSIFYGSTLVEDNYNNSNSNSNYTNNTKLYMFGVLTATEYPQTWIYNFNTNTLDTLADLTITMNTLVLEPCSTYDKTNNYIYILGGWAVNQGSIVDEENFLQVFDITTQTFLHTVDDLNWQPLSNFSNYYSRIWGRCTFDSKNNKIYYFGGFNSEDGTLDSILIYNINKHIWNELSNTLPFDIAVFDLLRIGRQIWLFGGVSLSNQLYTPTIEYIDLDTQVSGILMNQQTGEPVLLDPVLYRVAGIYTTSISYIFCIIIH